MDIMGFVPENLIILIIATFVFGSFLKQSKIKDEFIPAILMVGCVIGSIAINFNVTNIVTSVLQGILCWGVAIGINNVDRQFVKLTKREEKDDNKFRNIVDYDKIEEIMVDTEEEKDE